MNFRLVFKLCGRLLLVEAALMLLPLITALVYGEDPSPFLKSIPIVAAVGLVLSLIPADRHFFVREGFFAAGMLWILMGLGGAKVEENCLTHEEVTKVTRFAKVKVSFDELVDGQLKARRRDYVGWTAQMIQHMVDHCKGKLV